jgi:hypothetical protein
MVMTPYHIKDLSSSRDFRTILQSATRQESHIFVQARTNHENLHPIPRPSVIRGTR